MSELLNSHRFTITVKDKDLAIVRKFQNSLGIRHERAHMVVKIGIRQLAQIIVNNDLISSLEEEDVEKQIRALDFFTDKEQARDRNTNYTIRRLRLKISELKDQLKEKDKKSDALRFAAGMGPAKQRPLSERKADAKKRGWKWDEENDRLMMNDDGSAVMLEEE